MENLALCSLLLRSDIIITDKIENKNYLIKLINLIVGMLLPDITRKNKHGRLKAMFPQIYGTMK